MVGGVDLVNGFVVRRFFLESLVPSRRLRGLVQFWKWRKPRFYAVIISNTRLLEVLELVGVQNSFQYGNYFYEIRPERVFLTRRRSPVGFWLSGNPVPLDVEGDFMKAGAVMDEIVSGEVIRKALKSESKFKINFVWILLGLGLIGVVVFIVMFFGGG